MTFIGAVKICFVKYVDFNGCASRPEFWWWFLFTLLATAALRTVSYNVDPAHHFLRGADARKSIRVRGLGTYGPATGGLLRRGAITPERRGRPA
jgi:Protein of unknown function (DUF805)